MPTLTRRQKKHTNSIQNIDKKYQKNVLKSQKNGFPELDSDRYELQSKLS